MSPGSSSLYVVTLYRKDHGARAAALGECAVAAIEGSSERSSPDPRERIHASRMLTLFRVVASFASVAYFPGR
jgi:hypothetical protein